MLASFDLYVGSSFQSSTFLGWCECILSVLELDVASMALTAAALGPLGWEFLLDVARSLESGGVFDGACLTLIESYAGGWSGRSLYVGSVVAVLSMLLLGSTDGRCPKLAIPCCAAASSCP